MGAPPKKKINTQKNQIKKKKLLMTMAGYVQTVVKFGMMMEIVDG